MSSSRPMIGQLSVFSIIKAFPLVNVDAVDCDETSIEKVWFFYMYFQVCCNDQFDMFHSRQRSILRKLKPRAA